jgi:DNA-3-methyladenine glycosylase II
MDDAPSSTSVRLKAPTVEQLTFSIVPVAPFRLDLTVWALRRRRQNAVDCWDGGTYRRVFAFGDSPIELAVQQSTRSKPACLQITVTGKRLQPDSKQVAKAMVVKMFGPRSDLTPFYQLARRDPNSFGRCAQMTAQADS